VRQSTISRVGRGTVACAVLLAAPTARAQVGSGWVQYSPSYYVQMETHGVYTNHPPGDHYVQEGSSYDKVNGVETFQLTSTASNRVEIRCREEYDSGRRQFEGEIRVTAPTNDESVFQVFHVMLLRFMAASGGQFAWHLHDSPTMTIGSGYYGQWIKVNVIHDADTNHITLYVNGSSKGTQPNPDQVMYLKYGVYGTLGAASAKVEWRNVKFFTGGGTATATPTARPTATPTATPTPRSTPTPTPSSNDVEVTPAAGAVTASTNDGNVPGNVVDDSLATRWSANGDGQWVKLDLGQTRTVTRVRVAAYNGNARQNRFDLQVSSDNATWTNVVTDATTSGTTTQEETFNFADRAARWVRYLGHGNSVNAFNSVTEISVFALAATPAPTITPTATATPMATPTSTPTGYVEVTPTGAAVTASTNDGNVPANAVDNSLGTRWSANGDGQWLQLDLGAARTVGHVKVAVYNGNTRSNTFDLQVSTAAGVWTTVFSGKSSGTTTAEETYDFPDMSARWVRYLGHMNSVNGFNSVTEVSVFALP
jgi:hypothetical protein